MLRLNIAKPSVANTAILATGNVIIPVTTPVGNKMPDIRPLIGQDWSLERIAREAKPPTWEKVWDDASHELKDVSEILDNQEKTYGQYYPLKRDIFNAFWLTKLSNVKVVILGQDPYHQTISVNGGTVPRAIGLSFSVRREDAIPSSLKNIYTELANSVRGFVRPDHGDLTEWAEQGVLLLNSCLTVRPGAPGSHGDIWLGFISKVFKAIATINPYCVFLLWGRDAQKVKPMLGERSFILEAAHPSGLSANRGFFGCNHFNEMNKYLMKLDKPAINWKISTLAELTNPTANVVPLVTNTIQRTFVPIDTNNMLSYSPVGKIPSATSATSAIQATPLIPPIRQVLNDDNNNKRRVLPMIPNVRTTLSDVGIPNIPVINYGNTNSNYTRPAMPNHSVNK